MILFHRTDSFNSAPGESELLWYLRTSPAAVKPELSSSEVKERRGGKRPNIRAGHHKTLFTRFSSNAFLSSLSSLFTLSFLSLLFSHVKLFLWLQYFKSICYFRKTHEIIVVCVCRWTAGWVLERRGFARQKNTNVFIRMWFLKSAMHFWPLIQLIALVDTWKWVASYQMKLDDLYLVLLSGTES